MPALVGIINVTADSFSDGGRFLNPESAKAHGDLLCEQGADWLDLGAESSNPDGASVPATLEIERLVPLVRYFTNRGARVSVDTYKPAVMAAVLDAGATMINDISALADPAALPVLLRFPAAQVVLMHNRNPGSRARTGADPAPNLIADIEHFFRTRLAALAAAGFDSTRCILDPGMGFFLGPDPTSSLAVLNALPRLRAQGRPLYIATSRKSFIGSCLGGRPPEKRAAGTLATELWALAHGADFIRTHDVGAIADAWALWRALQSQSGAS